MLILKYISIPLIVATTVFFFVAGNGADGRSFSGQTMGTYYNIKIRGTKNSAPVEEVIRKTLAEVNAQMSIFDPDSEISAINNAPANTWIELSNAMQKVLQTARTVYEQSNGAFDPAVGELIELWGFGSNRKKDQPADKEIQQALKNAGFDKISFTPDGTKLKKENDRIKLNLSAIAKGYGVDRVAEELENLGIRDYIVEIGGEVRAAGSRQNNSSGWNIGIARPQNGHTENVYVLTVRNIAVATSGDYRNFFYDSGKKFTHTISPKTGRPVENKMVSATVFHPNCMMADALATALMSMGETKVEEFVRQHNLAAILFIRNDQNTLTPLLSAKAKEMMGEK